MMDDSASTHNRRKLVKIYKTVLTQKQTVVAEVCRETYSPKMIKRWSSKTAHKRITPQNKGKHWERERQGNWFCGKRFDLVLFNKHSLISLPLGCNRFYLNQERVQLNNQHKSGMRLKFSFQFFTDKNFKRTENKFVAISPRTDTFPLNQSRLTTCTKTIEKGDWFNLSPFSPGTDTYIPSE